MMMMRRRKTTRMTTGTFIWFPLTEKGVLVLLSFV
mgnify:CR=1 FL=1